MSQTFAEQLGGEIRIEHAPLRGEAVGADTRYRVSLSAALDARRVAAFQAMLAEMPQHRRFRLDPSGTALAFSCRSVEGPAGVFDMLQRAEALLEMLGRRLEAVPHETVARPPAMSSLA